MDLWKLVEQSNTIAISGHCRPDGDCIGASLALYLYILKNYNGDFQKKVSLFLETPGKEFSILNGIQAIDSSFESDVKYDLYFALDCGSIDRLGDAQPLFAQAENTVCIDHHVSNTIPFAKYNVVDPSASSTSEIVFRLMEKEKINDKIAEALYVGLIHDTGVFRHDCTSPATLRAAADLMEFGIRANELVEYTYYQKTYIQNQLLGRCLLESILLLDGKIIVAEVSQKMLEFYKGTSDDLEGVIDQLCLTKGVEVAILAKEKGTLCYKVSMRSNGLVDVSKIAVMFGGGGHVRAAGCTMNGTRHDVINNLTLPMEEQLLKAGK